MFSCHCKIILRNLLKLNQQNIEIIQGYFGALHGIFVSVELPKQLIAFSFKMLLGLPTQSKSTCQFKLQRFCENNCSELAASAHAVLKP